jgi:hypothetical protein
MSLRSQGALGLSFLALTLNIGAQKLTGSIAGRVIDPSGAAIGKAAVIIRNTDFSTARIVQTDR